MWDGAWYVGIVKDGYSYDPSRQSNVNFYPLYPLLARLTKVITGIDPRICLLLVSNAAFAIGCVLLSLYMRTRQADAIKPRYESVLLCILLVPTSFYFRIAYSESLFFCLSVAVFLAIASRAPVPVVAGLAGLTTATRSVGVAFLPVVAWYAWQRSPQFWKRAANLAAVPLSLSGLIGYAGWLALRFGDGFAFVKTQQHWKLRPLPDGISVVKEYARLAQIVDVFNSHSPCYWATKTPEGIALFNLSFMNPCVFVCTLGLIALGARKRWLSGYEAIASLGFLLIPYFSIGYRVCMQSHARYALVAFPAMIVLAILIERLPHWCQSTLLAMSGALLAAYATLFFARYLFI
jgi:hypothetical protein